MRVWCNVGFATVFIILPYLRDVHIVGFTVYVYYITDWLQFFCLLCELNVVKCTLTLLQDTRRTPYLALAHFRLSVVNCKPMCTSNYQSYYNTCTCVVVPYVFIIINISRSDMVQMIQLLYWTVCLAYLLTYL